MTWATNPHVFYKPVLMQASVKWSLYHNGVVCWQYVSQLLQVQCALRLLLLRAKAATAFSAS